MSFLSTVSLPKGTSGGFLNSVVPPPKGYVAPAVATTPTAPDVPTVVINGVKIGTAQTIKDIMAGLTGGVNDVKNAFTSGLAQSAAGSQEANAKGATLPQIGEGLLNFGAGAVGAAFSPLAPIFSPIGQLINAAGEQLAKTPLISQYGKDVQQLPASQDPAIRILTAIQNISTIGQGVLGTGLFKGKEIPQTSIETPTKLPVQSTATETPIPIHNAEIPLPVEHAPTVEPQPEPAISTVPPELEPLAKEAQKYKSAEEFGNSLTKNLGKRFQSSDFEIDTVGVKNLRRTERSSDIQKSAVENAVKEIQRGESKPIVVNKNNEILDGHHRYEAYKQLGIDEVPVLKMWGENKYGKPIIENVTDFYNKVTAEAPKTTRTTQTLKPIEGTGAIKTRGVSASLETAAISKGLSEGFGNLPEFQGADFNKIANDISDHIAKDPEGALQIALGNKAAPKGSIPEMYLNVLGKEAFAKGDTATIHRLATQSKLSAGATTMGQRLAALGYKKDELNPVETITDIQKARQSMQEARGRVSSKEMAQAKSYIKKANTKESWSSFVNSITC